MRLDHLAVAGESLEAAVAHVEHALGVAMVPGGQHVHFGTHNRLLGLGGGLYLEAISVDPAAPPLGYARWFDLDRFEGQARLGNWICRSDNLEADVKVFGTGVGRPVALQRGDLKWRMAVPESGVLPYDNVFPALMQWDVAVTPAAMLPASGCRLRLLEIFHPDAEKLKAELHLNDPKVVIRTGAPGMAASFDTPHGTRVLT